MIYHLGDSLRCLNRKLSEVVVAAVDILALVLVVTVVCVCVCVHACPVSIRFQVEFVRRDTHTVDPDICPVCIPIKILPQRVLEIASRRHLGPPAQRADTLAIVY